jgi:hypothetical protein
MRSAFKSPGVPPAREAGTASLVGGPSKRPMRAGVRRKQLLNHGSAFDSSFANFT